VQPTPDDAHVRSLLLALVLFSSGCTSLPAGSPTSASPNVAQSSSAAASAAPTESVAAGTPTPARSLAAPPPTAPAPSPVRPIAALSVSASGKLAGEIAWVVNAPSTIETRPRVPTTLELWAIPLDGSTPRLAVRYASTQLSRFGLAGQLVDTNVIRRQFSPDGRRIVLSVALGGNGDRHALAVVDLESGSVVAQVASPDFDYLTPTWSPDGSKIAFLRATTGLSTEIWVMNSDATGQRRLRPAAVGTSTPLFGWTPDSARVGFAPINFERTAYALIDMNGAVTSETPAFTAPNTRDPIDWRAKSPAFALSFQDPGPQTTRTNVVVGQDTSELRPRIVADVVINVNDNNVLGVRDPRWDPSGRDRLIYIEYGTLGSFVIADVANGVATKQISSRVSKAEWSPDGSTIVTLEEHPSTAPLMVNRYDPDGRILGNPLPLSKTDTSYRLIDLAPRTY